MADFDPEKFEDKYANYFPELQQAYKNAFNRMNDRYDSELVHAIDQQVLNESEPFYVGDDDDYESAFRIELPDQPHDRLSGVVVEKERFDQLLERHVEEIETELERVFGLQ
ncbi:hypothetical protein SAMN04487967_3210 [Natronorubrum sediminis]|uniref:Uncharacterized protein n=1 Tax=Natronorubrum sediminis TaxID=640943 RepID=A0A1H6G583_9EURY|nr:DUF5783 family protein [Natronorubrum sediminis]SEH17493.1 hypothetical protein SAMN04487967_3210 [Natronorubrum sediminis]